MIECLNGVSEWFSGWNWGDVPTWVSSVGGLGALGAASFAAWKTHELFKIESGRDEAARERDERAQADLVAAWLDKDPIFCPPIPPWHVVITNASTVPVYDLLTAVTVPVSGTEDDLNGIKRSFPVVPPGERQSPIQNLLKLMTSSLPEDEALAEMERLKGRKDAVIAGCGVWVTFRDASGVHWTRSNEGILSRGVSGPFARKTVPDTWA